MFARAITTPFRALSSLLSQRFQRWAHARQPRADTQALTHRNVYILPTQAGAVFAGTLLILLLASINYQLNLGHALTFLLAGSAVSAMHVTHSTLRGLTLHLRPPQPVFAQQSALLEAVIHSAPHHRRERLGIGMRLQNGPLAATAWVNVPAGGHTTVHLSFVPDRRGRHGLPPWTVETRFPLGLFKAWGIWRPVSELLAYPVPETQPPPLPTSHGSPDGHQTTPHRQQGRGEPDGIRSYRRGDPLKAIVWKKAAQAMASGSELVSRDTHSPAPSHLWLDWQDCGHLSSEAKLSRLTAWVLQAHQQDIPFGLRLPRLELSPASGEAHRDAALQALALWQTV